MRGEEAAVLRAFARIKATMPSALLDSRAAPARAVRRSRAARARRRASSTVRRSELPIDAEPRADVVVLDTIGELAQLYQLATAVFVGGSLVDHGGHNILEPAVFGKPIVFGPHMQNFQEIADAFLANGAAVQVQSERELDEALLTLVTDPVRRARLGAAARALVEANRGAKDKTLAVIAELLPPAGGGARPRRRAALPTGALIRDARARCTARSAAWRRALVRARPVAPAPAGAPGHQRRQSARRRQRQDAGRRAHRAAARRARRAAGDSDARLRATRRRRRRDRRVATARASWPTSTRPATSR